MAVFRINKTRDYTVMSNYHLKDTRLSLKSKGLLSMMLSLPEEWNYTTRGLAAICKEGVDSIGTALKELERSGYIQRNRIRDDKGKITDTEYIIFEKPQEKPDTECQDTAEPYTENPYMDKPNTETPGTENTAQLNTNISNTKELNTDVLNTYPIKSHQEQDTIGYDEVEAYRQVIKENIEYDILCVKLKSDIAMLDEIVDLLTETVCTSKNSLIIAGDTYPAAVVKSKLLKLNSEHIEYVIDCMHANTTDIRNIKKYLLAALFNAPSTIDSYYTSKVNHDMYGGKYE